jgi:hypothetical protein
MDDQVELDGPIGAERRQWTFHIDGIPERDRRDDQTEATGPVSLILEGSVAALAESVEENSTEK